MIRFSRSEGVTKVSRDLDTWVRDYLTRRDFTFQGLKYVIAYLGTLCNL
jgi:hypothetical protein